LLIPEASERGAAQALLLVQYEVVLAKDVFDRGWKCLINSCSWLSHSVRFCPLPCLASRGALDSGERRATPSASLFILSDEVVQLYVLTKLDVEDLCMFARVSQRCKQLVATSDEAWAAVHNQLFGAWPFQPKPEGRSWREDVRKKYLSRRTLHRLERQARLCSMTSEAQARSAQRMLRRRRCGRCLEACC